MHVALLSCVVGVPTSCGHLFQLWVEAHFRALVNAINAWLGI